MLMTQDVLIQEIVSGFCESMYFELFSFKIKRGARRGCDVFTHKSHNEKGANFCCCCFIFSFGEKKQVLLEVSHSPQNYNSFTTGYNSLY